jgi:hypothetical protein
VPYGNSAMQPKQSTDAKNKNGVAHTNINKNGNDVVKIAIVSSAILSLPTYRSKERIT